MTSRIHLHLRFRTKPGNAESLLAFLRRAVPYYEAPGGIRVRLLQSVKDPDSFVEIVEYETKDAFDRDQQRVANDPEMRALLSEWRDLLAESAVVESFQELTSMITCSPELQSEYGGAI